MGCLIALIAMVSPRAAFVLIWIFKSERVSLAFDGSWFLPLLGLLFLPWTALAWVVCYSPINHVSGFGWFVVSVCYEQLFKLHAANLRSDQWD